MRSNKYMLHVLPGRNLFGIRVVNSLERAFGCCLCFRLRALTLSQCVILVRCTPSSPAPPSRPEVVSSGSEKTRWRWLKCQAAGFKTVVHKPTGDISPFIQSMVLFSLPAEAQCLNNTKMGLLIGQVLSVVCSVCVSPQNLPEPQFKSSHLFLFLI